MLGGRGMHHICCICPLEGMNFSLFGTTASGKQTAPVAASTKDQASNATNTRHLMQAAARTLQAPPVCIVSLRVGVEKPGIMMALKR